jgi:hypothetical protein
LRSGSFGCATTANPVPLHAAHFCSVEFAAGFLILNFSGGLNRRSAIVRVKRASYQNCNSAIWREILSPDTGCAARHAGGVKTEGRKAELPVTPRRRRSNVGDDANVTVEREGKLCASDAASAIAFNDGDRHRASGGRQQARRMSAVDILRSVGYRTDSSYNLSYP